MARLAIPMDKRPQVLIGKTQRIVAGCGSLYITQNVDPETGKLAEVFVTLGKSGGCAAAQCEAIGRLVSLGLRRGIEVDDIVKHLQGISCHAPAGFGANKVMSCADGIATAIRTWEPSTPPPAQAEEKEADEKS